jgi:hypothetical protein
MVNLYVNTLVQNIYTTRFLYALYLYAFYLYGSVKYQNYWEFVLKYGVLWFYSLIQKLNKNTICFKKTD